MQRNAALAVLALGAGAVALGRARAPATREQQPAGAVREVWFTRRVASSRSSGTSGGSMIAR